MLARWSLLLFVLLPAAAVAQAQPAPATGILVAGVPVYLSPDATRPPVATLATGAAVILLERQGDWYRIQFHDASNVDRTGYVPAANIRLDQASPAAIVPQAAPSPTAAPRAAAAPSQPLRATPIHLIEPDDIGYVWISATYQRESTAFSAASTFRQNGGTGSFTAHYAGVHPAPGDVAAGVRIWQGLSVGVAGTWAAQITDAAVSAISPSPVNGAGRGVFGVAHAINRKEFGLHFDAGWAVPTRGRVQVVVFAGPSLFRVTQGLVTGVNVNDPPPFDATTFASATVVETHRSHIGANGGVEASVRVWKALGVGAIARFSRATMPFDAVDGTTLKIRAGGLQGGGGLHVRF